MLAGCSWPAGLTDDPEEAHTIVVNTAASFSPLPKILDTIVELPVQKTVLPAAGRHGCLPTLRDRSRPSRSDTFWYRRLRPDRKAPGLPSERKAIRGPGPGLLERQDVPVCSQPRTWPTEDPEGSAPLHLLYPEIAGTTKRP